MQLPQNAYCLLWLRRMKQHRCFFVTVSFFVYTFLFLSFFISFSLIWFKKMHSEFLRLIFSLIFILLRFSLSLHIRYIFQYWFVSDSCLPCYVTSFFFSCFALFVRMRPIWEILHWWKTEERVSSFIVTNFSVSIIRQSSIKSFDWPILLHTFHFEKHASLQKMSVRLRNHFIAISNAWIEYAKYDSDFSSSPHTHKQREREIVSLKCLYYECDVRYCYKYYNLFSV